MRVELEAIANALARAVGFGGRPRRAGSHAERGRVNATRALGLAVRKIAAEHPALGEHFARTIRTGNVYSPRDAPGDPPF